MSECCFLSHGGHADVFACDTERIMLFREHRGAGPEASQFARVAARHANELAPVDNAVGVLPGVRLGENHVAAHQVHAAIHLRKTNKVLAQCTGQRLNSPGHKLEEALWLRFHRNQGSGGHKRASSKKGGWFVIVFTLGT